MATPNFGLANQVNQFMGQQVRAPFLANLPNYDGMIGQRSANTTNMLQGNLPPDVIRQIQQRGAERGVATGMTGGPNANASWLQALGLNTLGMQLQGSKELSQSIADTPEPEPWNPISLYLAELENEQAQKSANPTPWKTQEMNPWFQPNRWSSPSGQTSGALG